MSWQRGYAVFVLLLVVSLSAYAQETPRAEEGSVFPVETTVQSGEARNLRPLPVQQDGTGTSAVSGEIEKEPFESRFLPPSGLSIEPAVSDTGVIVLRHYFAEGDDETSDASGDYTIASGTLNTVINDQYYYWYRMWLSDPSFIPDTAVVTNFEYRLRLTYASDPGTFWCGDYEIYLSSTANGAPNKYLNVYDNLGGLTDGGYDDDAEDDSDIFLNWRSTSQFNGEDPAQAWSVWIEDTLPEDHGMLEYVEFRISYSTDARPDLTSTYVNFTDWTVVENTEFWIGPWITNEGDAGASESHVRLFLSTDNDFDVSDDYEVFPKKLVPSLMPDAQAQVDWTFTFPDLNGEDIGVCYDVWLVTWVDCDDENAEWNENNIYKTNNPIEVSDPLGLPNLRPYHPSGWDDMIVVSPVQGTNTDGDVYENQPIYVDYSYGNDSTEDIPQTFHNNIFIDGVLQMTTYMDGLQAYYYSATQDREFTVSGEGWHTITLVIDKDDEVAESDENDNTYERQFYLNPDNSPPDINVYPLEIHVYQ